jgi:hypothetical protein
LSLAGTIGRAKHRVSDNAAVEGSARIALGQGLKMWLVRARERVSTQRKLATNKHQVKIAET